MLHVCQTERLRITTRKLFSYGRSLVGPGQFVSSHWLETQIRFHPSENVKSWSVFFTLSVLKWLHRLLSRLRGTVVVCAANNNYNYIDRMADYFSNILFYF